MAHELPITSTNYPTHYAQKKDFNGRVGAHELPTKDLSKDLSKDSPLDKARSGEPDAHRCERVFEPKAKRALEKHLRANGFGQGTSKRIVGLIVSFLEKSREGEES